MMALLLIHAFATLWMVGLVWFVQVVHYPLYAKVPHQAFADYERFHVRRTGLVTGPPMLAELGSAIALATLHASTLGRPLLLTGLGLLAVVWISTFGVQVPLHARLEQGRDDVLIRRLIATNWVRTIAWTARGGIALALLAGSHAA